MPWDCGDLIFEFIQINGVFQSLSEQNTSFCYQMLDQLLPLHETETSIFSRITLLCAISFSVSVLFACKTN